MSRELQARIGLDLIMTIILLCGFAYRIIGDLAHEWIGIALCVLFITHNVLNWRWYRNIFNGHYTARRIVIAVINLLLIVIITVLIITGLLHSRTVLAVLHLSGGMLLRQIHTTTAYWSLILVAAHIGLHWEIISSVVQKMTGFTGVSRIRSSILRVSTVLLIIYGLWAFWDRDMAAKLFQGHSFDFWNPESPAILFFTSNLALLGLYVVGTRSLFKLMMKF